MDNIISKIKTYVLIVNPALTDDSFLDFVIRDVVDRAMIYMNRQDLVYQYEKDLESYPQDNSSYDYFWAHYDYPVPPRIERSLASSVIGVFNSVKRSISNVEGGSIKTVKDHDQEVTYTEKVTEFLSSSDEVIFNGIKEILDRYRLFGVASRDVNYDRTNNYRDFISR